MVSAVLVDQGILAADLAVQGPGTWVAVAAVRPSADFSCPWTAAIVVAGYFRAVHLRPAPR